MISYASWPTKNVAVTSLLLDPKNPRIPSTGKALEQRDLIEELVIHDKVYELAKSIVDDGFSPLETLIALTEESKTLILEGNRRLAALKLLIAPEMAPDKAIKKFRALAAIADLESFKTVRVVFAPSREDAAPLIIQKHTRDQVARWSPVMQAKYFRSLAVGGMTPSQIATRYGRTAGEVAEFLRTDTMYEVACALTGLPPDVQKAVTNPREFNPTILQRVTNTPKGREFLGIEFDDHGGIHGKVHPDEFRKAFGRILTDIVRKKVDTRKLNSVADAERYLSSLASAAPDRSRRGSFTDKDLLNGRVSGTRRVAPAAKARKAVARVSTGLIPTGMRCRVSNPKIMEVFGELRQLKKVDQFPNACAGLLRTLLELGMGHYLEKTGKMDKILERAKAKGRKEDWYPTWKMLLAEVLGDPAIRLSPLARKRLSKLAADTDYSFLDGVIHNSFVIADTRELRNLAAAMEGLFEIILTEPAKSA